MEPPVLASIPKLTARIAERRQAARTTAVKCPSLAAGTGVAGGLATAKWARAFGAGGLRVFGAGLRLFGVKVGHVAKLVAAMAISIVKLSRYRKECQVF